MTLLNRKGQSTGEYAVLFAVVLGAVIAMQNYVRNRIAGGISAQADLYQTAVGGAANPGITSASNSNATSTTNMTDALTGSVGQTGTSSSTINYPQ